MGTYGQPKPFPGAEIRHMNGNRTDNRVENLRWGTARENAADRAHHGMTVRGSRVTGSKLKEEQVMEARRRVAAGERRASLAREFGISRTNLNKAVAGISWAHLPGAVRVTVEEVNDAV